MEWILQDHQKHTFDYDDEIIEMFVGDTSVSMTVHHKSRSRWTWI